MPNLSNRWRTAAAFLAVMVSAVVAVGCGSDTVDASKAEGGIENSLSTSTTKITSASCPDDATKENGKTFTCDVKLSGGGKAEVTVTQTSDHNTFSYAFKPGSVVLPGSEVDEQIEKELADAGVENATVNCPDEVPVKLNTTVTCPITGGSGGQATVSFQFSDSSGTVDSSSVEES